MKRKMNKKGIAPVIAYVLLIAMGVAASGIVYQGIRSIAVSEEDVITCPEAVDVVIRDYQCSLGKSFCMTVSNKGRFNASGYEVNVDNNTVRSFEIYNINKSGSSLIPGQEQKVSYKFNIPYKKGEETGVLQNLNYVEVRPFRIIDGEKFLCDSIISQKVNCQVSNYDCANPCTSALDCEDFKQCTTDVCSNGICYNNVYCPEGQSCGEGSGQCIPPNGCIENLDCPNGESCSNGNCVECDDNLDCDDGLSCTSNVCDLATNTCNYPSACAGESCSAYGENYCGNDGNVYNNRTCNFESCVSDSCVPTTKLEEKLISTCGEGASCVNGACQTVIPAKADVIIIAGDGASIPCGPWQDGIEAISSFTEDLTSEITNDRAIGFVDLGSNYIYSYDGPGSFYNTIPQDYGNYKSYSNFMIGGKPAFSINGTHVLGGAWKLNNNWPDAGVNCESGLHDIKDAFDIARFLLNTTNGLDRDDSVYPDYVVVVGHKSVPAAPSSSSQGNKFGINEYCSISLTEPQLTQCRIQMAKNAADRLKSEGIKIYGVAVPELYSGDLNSAQSNLTVLMKYNVSSSVNHYLYSNNYGELRNSYALSQIVTG